MARFDRYFSGGDDGRDRARRSSDDDAIVGLPEGGEWTARGVYRLEHRYPLGTVHGSTFVDCPDDIPIMKPLGAEGAVTFLDLETTGLSRGTGTYAFLCGIGRVLGDAFVVSQFFLSSPAHEAAWLRSVDDEIPRSGTLATYNGAAFDLPLLRTRHVLARMEPHWDSHPHIDVLHLARRFYKGHLQSCSLSSMETNVLGLARTDDDVPGAMIPGLYADLLRTRDARPLSGVFYHNDLDIVSLAVLYCKIAEMLGGRSDAREAMRAGEMWHQLGSFERARDCYRRALDDPRHEVSAMFSLAMISKHVQDLGRAHAELMNALDFITERRGAMSERANIYTICVELAKIEEHSRKDIDAALRAANTAKQWLRQNRHLFGSRFSAAFSEVEHRIQRLTRKSGKHA